MPPTLYRPSQFKVSDLISRINLSEMALPDIQRPFVWSKTKVRELLHSMYYGYPVGTLMFWETGAKVGQRQIAGSKSDSLASYLIVDGQQRITSLFAVMTGQSIINKKFNNEQIRIAFHPIDESFEVTSAAIAKNPLYIPNITILWNEGYRAKVRKYLSYLDNNQSERLGDIDVDELEERVYRVRDLQEYSFQALIISADADEEQVAEIFVRTNSQGVNLGQADFILTLMSVHWEEGRQQLETFCRNSVNPLKLPSPKNQYIDPTSDQLLRVVVGLAFRRARLRNVYKILRGKNLKTDTFSESHRTEHFNKLRRAQGETLDLNNWHDFFKCLTRAGFLNSRMITSTIALIYTYILWLIGKRDFCLNHKQLQEVIARWFFMVHTTGRYTSSPETQLERDLGRIDTLESGNGEAFCAELDQIIESNFTNDYWEITLPSLLDRSTHKSPALSAYWAALNLLDAKLLFSDLKVSEHLTTHTAPRSVERDHLFPKAYLSGIGITTKQVNAIANMAFIDWPDNVKIGDKAPSDYWPNLIDSLDASQLQDQRYWHALPVDWEKLDYPEFLKHRRRLIAKVIRDGFNKLQEGKTLDNSDNSSTITDLIMAGETQTTEFKSSARWNIRAKIYDKKMINPITKAVCGFLNAEGGTLLIGVDDNGKLLGLEKDMKTLGKKGNQDGYELFLRQHLDNYLSIQTAKVVRITFESIEEAVICKVSVTASGKPVFSKSIGGNNIDEFWVRIGNATKQLYGEDMMNYRSEHWEG